MCDVIVDDVMCVCLSMENFNAMCMHVATSAQFSGGEEVDTKMTICILSLM